MSSATRTVSAPDPLVSPVSSSKRYLAVDLLRGLTIAFMILVNNGTERSFSALKHAEWNGFTPTDLVFPTFLFLVGASIVFSTESRLARGVTRASLFAHTVRRAIIIYLLGLVVNSAPFFRLSTMRYYGVLPRIALCYLIVASLYIWIRRPVGSAAGQPTVADKVGLLVACLLGYYLIMRFVPVPGFGLPGRDIPFLDRDANIVAWLDRQIFSASHLYEHTRDPEGLISTIPALGTTLMGVLTGLFLRTSRPDSRKALTLAIAGASSVLLGLIWNPWFPLNKKLWTSSFVLYAAGWSLLILAAFWFLVQVRNYRRGTWILLVFGTNAITAYVISELMADCLDKVRVGPHSNVLRWTAEHIAAAMPAWPALGALAYSLLYVLVCWLLVLPLYRKKIFIKI